MKLLILSILLFASAAVFADNYDEIDWSQVMAREDEPGFWDSRDEGLKPLPVDVRSRRIIGGWEVERNSHPYAVFLLMTSGSSSFR